MSHVLSYILILAVVAWSVNVKCSEHEKPLEGNKVNIVYVDFPLLLSENAEQEGLYNQKISRVHKNIATGVSGQFISVERAYFEFNNKHFDCIFPANSYEVKERSDIAVSKAFGEANAYIYTLATEPVINDVSLLAGKRLGVRRGFTYGDAVLPDATVKIEVDSTEQNIKMLAAGRVDAFLAYEPDATPIFEKFQHVTLHRHDSYSIYQQQDMIACYPNETTLKYIEEVNQQLK